MIQARRGIAPALAALAAVAFAARAQAQAAPPTAAKLRHIVVIFSENISFDHYFGTYPHAANPAGEPRFTAARGTPKVDGLTAALLRDNPNARNPANGTGAINPFRLDRSQAATPDQDHAYTAEQRAFDHDRMDLFPEFTGRGETAGAATGPLASHGLVMGYYDGNTVTALWNYAQHFALSDQFYETTMGPSTVGAINLVSGQTNAVGTLIQGRAGMVEGGGGSLTDISDSGPLHDVCASPTGTQFQMSGPNIGERLTAAGVSWGWFQGGFDLRQTNPNGSTGCRRSTLSPVVGKTFLDYVPYHEPFQYYAATANPRHLPPSSAAMVGTNADAANHQYDLSDFEAALKAGNFPQVSFLKAAAFEDGHAGHSDPLDEQRFLVRMVNLIESQPDWDHTAILIAYDDSDGWYDHAPPPRVNRSATASDALDGAGICNPDAPTLPGVKVAAAQGRCGYGPRLVLLAISPWARHNFVDHTVTDQTSILRLIEDADLGGKRLGGGSFDGIAHPLDGMFDFRAQRPKNRRALRLDPATGEAVAGPGN